MALRNSTSRRKPLRPVRARRAPLTAEALAGIDYKSPSTLRRYVSDRGKILPRRVTGLTATQQRHVATQIKRAREMALLHYTADQLR